MKGLIEELTQRSWFAVWYFVRPGTWTLQLSLMYVHSWQRVAIYTESTPRPFQSAMSVCCGCVVPSVKRAGDFWSSGLLCKVGKLAGGGPVAMAVWVGDRCTHYECHLPHQLNWCKILRTWRKKFSEYTRLVANLVLVTVLIFWIKNNWKKCYTVGFIGVNELKMREIKLIMDGWGVGGHYQLV